MKTPIEIKPSPCPSQARRRLACKISPPYVAPLTSSSRAHVMTQVAYLVDLLKFRERVKGKGKKGTVMEVFHDTAIRSVTCHRPM